MNSRTLREVAKFASGLVIGDFLMIVWLSMNDILPTSFMGIRLTYDMILPALVFDAALFFILVHYGWHVGKTPVLRERTFLLAAGTVFGIVALAHLMRVFTGADLIIYGWAVPLWLSWIGTAVTAYLAYMSFHLALRMR